MRNMVVLLLLTVSLLVMIQAASAQTAPLRAESNVLAQEEIKALDLKLADLIVHGRWDEYAQYLSSDYLHTGYNGQAENMEEALAALQDERRRIIVMEPEAAGERIRIYGDTAVFNHEFTISVREAGQLKSHRIRLTDVFVRREGKWFLIAGQTTAIGK